MQEVDPSWDANVIHTPAFGHLVGVSGHTIVVGSYAEDAMRTPGRTRSKSAAPTPLLATHLPPNWAARAWLKCVTSTGQYDGLEHCD